MHDIAWVETGGQKQQHDRSGTKTTSIGLGQTLTVKVGTNPFKHTPISGMLERIIGYFRPKLKDIAAQARLRFSYVKIAAPAPS
jgi:hypothetical protein